MAAVEGEVQETGWIDINLPAVDSEQEELNDSEPLERELSLDLEGADVEELPPDGIDDEGKMLFIGLTIIIIPIEMCECML